MDQLSFSSELWSALCFLALKHPLLPSRPPAAVCQRFSAASARRPRAASHSDGTEYGMQCIRIRIGRNAKWRFWMLQPKSTLFRPSSWRGHKYIELTMHRTPSQLPPEVGNNTQCVHYQLDCTVGPMFDGGTMCAVNINRHWTKWAVKIDRQAGLWMWNFTVKWFFFSGILQLKRNLVIWKYSSS